MRTSSIFLSALFHVSLTIACLGQSAPDPWLILAGGEKGPINAHTTRADLVRIYGAVNVVDKDMNLGEGEIERGTVLFPSDPERSIQILWNDAKKKAEPSTLTIRGNKSRWKTAHEISLGTSLKQLERLNGKPFHMSGYGWDYSGTITSWDGGRLAQSPGEVDPERGDRRVILRLTCSMTGAVSTTKEEDLQIAGDRDLSSNHPVLQKMNPCVGEIVWLFTAR